MRTWLVAILLLLLAAPFHPYWQNFEQARRGLLLLLVPVLCLLPRVFPKDMPRAVLPFLVLVVWLLLRSVGVHNPGLAWERTLLWLGLAALMIVGSSMAPRDIAIAALPAGAVVAAWALVQGIADLRPVSTLGNINVASEVLTMAGAAAALLPCMGERRKSLQVAALVTLFLCGAAVVANTSLSGLIALPLACLPVAFHKQIPGLTRFAVLTVLCSGMLLGTGLRPDAPAQDPTTESVAAASTTDVRLHLWNGTARMGVDRFLLGHGSGQFRVEYPRYRQPEEIEASSFGRGFSTAAESAHQDYLELFAEGGLLAFLLMAVGILQVLRQAPFWTWGPLLGFGFLAGVRSPLGNAPAAALLFLWMGTMLHEVHQRQERISLQFSGRGWVLGLLGLCILGVGAGGFLGQLTVTGYVREARGLRAGSEVARASIAAATFWNPFEQKFLQARAALSVTDLERSTAADRGKRIATASRDLEELLAVWPWDEEGLLLLGRSLQLAGKPVEAVTALSRLRRIDPQNPRATLLQATILVEAGKAPEALVLLYRDPHPRVLAGLPKHLADLHALAQRKGLTQDADLLLVEQAFFDSVDALRREPGFGSQLAVKNYLEEVQAHPHDLSDMRPLVIYALQFLALEKPDKARAVAKQAAKRKLPETYRRLMGNVLEPLLKMPEWQQVITSTEPGTKR